MEFRIHKLNRLLLNRLWALLSSPRTPNALPFRFH